MCLVPIEARRSHRVPGTGVTRVVSQPCGFWELALVLCKRNKCSEPLNTSSAQFAFLVLGIWISHCIKFKTIVAITLKYSVYLLPNIEWVLILSTLITEFLELKPFSALTVWHWETFEHFMPPLLRCRMMMLITASIFNTEDVVQLQPHWKGSVRARQFLVTSRLLHKYLKSTVQIWVMVSRA